MNIEDIASKEDSPYVLEIIKRLGIEPLFYLTAEEINTIVEEIKKIKENSSAEISLNGFVKNFEYNKENKTIQYEVEGREGVTVITLIPQEIIDRLEALESRTKPSGRQSDSFMVTATDISDGRIQKLLTHEPISGSLFVFVRGVFIDEDAYELNEKNFTIFGNRYDIKEGDLISARYEYLITE